MPGAAEFLWPVTRLSPAGFLVAFVVATLVVVVGAALVVAGRWEGWLVWLAGLWSWLVVHANRRHDSGDGALVLLLLAPLLAPATLVLGAAVAVVTGLDMPDVSRPATGKESPFAMFQVFVRLFLTMAEVNIGRGEVLGAVLTAAALPLAPCLVASLLIGFGRADPAPNRWGPPP
jgi:multisubunit Na+/H+ antiporter MnhE subunit